MQTCNDEAKSFTAKIKKPKKADQDKKIKCVIPTDKQIEAFIDSVGQISDILVEIVQFVEKCKYKELKTYPVKLQTVMDLQIDLKKLKEMPTT